MGVIPSPVFFLWEGAISERGWLGRWRAGW